MRTIKKDLSLHFSHYLLLACLQAVGVIGIYHFKFDSRLQFAFAIYMSVSYVVWSVFHHHLGRDFHLKIIFEYILYAALAILLLGVLILKP